MGTTITVAAPALPASVLRRATLSADQGMVHRARAKLMWYSQQDRFPGRFRTTPSWSSTIQLGSGYQLGEWMPLARGFRFPRLSASRQRGIRAQLFEGVEQGQQSPCCATCRRHGLRPAKAEGQRSWSGGGTHRRKRSQKVLISGLDSPGHHLHGSAQRHELDNLIELFLSTGPAAPFQKAIVR